MGDYSRRTVLIGAAVLPLVPSRLLATGDMRMVRDKEIIWRRVMDDLSFEHAYVRQGPSGLSFGGTVLVSEKGAPLRIEYQGDCDDMWQTRKVALAQTYHGSAASLLLEHDGRGTWRRNGATAPDLAGCTDVDLGVSPSTNALPVNRLRLAPGASSTIRAAWVRFPSLDVEVAEQSYQRIADRRYHYRSLASGFEAQVEVDEDGFPTDYAGIWLRLGAGGLARQPSAMHGQPGFAGALVSPGPADDMADVAADFGWLVGGWSADVFDYDPDGEVRTGAGEWWFSWVLEGRAIQDVWISPPRALRCASCAPQTANNRYGTSLRHFDRDEGLWRITWINPVSGAVNALSGRRDGNRIVLLGEGDGDSIRWSFNDISNQSFVWTGERLGKDGTWRKEAEFRLRRIASMRAVSPRQGSV
ncbi:MAG TPA: putative glycolipid-binding domain-containing protein [Pedomonas sp.]|uniref:putative glycolipid-binding domain-containing protein n=1 Tax=Pedomonas sp. TaxID=2976421 RepID=UPI002F419E3A